jgi:ribosomal protein S18 acetylase RimI-like enzyme
VEFLIGRIEEVEISDGEIFDLLSVVYVQAGFTSSETARSIFDPVKVKNRGVLFVSKEASSNELAGLVIVVPSTSIAAVLAKENEYEMHLLGVLPKYRGYGLGRKLVNEALNFATDSGCSKMILWTQKPMKEAQSLYESFGFKRCGEMNKNGLDFLVYEKDCS